MNYVSKALAGAACSALIFGCASEPVETSDEQSDSTEQVDEPPELDPSPEQYVNPCPSSIVQFELANGDLVTVTIPSACELHYLDKGDPPDDELGHPTVDNPTLDPAQPSAAQ